MLSEYTKTWLKSLSVDNVTEEWHFDVLQSQFITGEAIKASRDFVSYWTQDNYFYTVPLHEREMIVEKAASILVANGYFPKINPLWFPNAYVKYTVWK